MRPPAARSSLYCSVCVFTLGCLLTAGMGGGPRTAGTAVAQERTPQDGPPRVTLIAEIENPVRLLEHQGIPVTVGYGSAVAVDPHHARRFFLLTDRGPNVDGAAGYLRFLMPEYSPRIGHFELVGQTLRLLSERELTDANGRRLTGLPPAPDAGGSGEVPERPDGTRLEFDREGIDSEGLVALPDGGFWVSEEYRPSLLHFNAEGRMIERIDPLDRDPVDCHKSFVVAVRIAVWKGSRSCRMARRWLPCRNNRWTIRPMIARRTLALYES